jgi:hypothetical protein
MKDINNPTARLVNCIKEPGQSSRRYGITAKHNTNTRSGNTKAVNTWGVIFEPRTCPKRWYTSSHDC